MTKKVTITLSLTEDFIRRLNTNVGLQGGALTKKTLDPMGVISRVVLAEARGAFPDQVAEIIGEDWKGEIVVDHDARTVDIGAEIEPMVQEWDDAHAERALLNELTWRTVIEKSYLEDVGQIDAAQRLVDKGSARWSKKKDPTSGDTIPVLTTKSS